MTPGEPDNEGVAAESDLAYGSGATVIPETTIEDTARAVRELVASGAVRVIDKDHRLTPAEIEAVLSNPESWNTERGAFLVEVVNEPKATDLLWERPASANPHRPLG